MEDKIIFVDDGQMTWSSQTKNSQWALCTQV